MSNKRKIVIGIVSLVFIISVVVVIMMTTGGDSNESKDDVQVNGDITSAPSATATDEGSSQPTATVPSTEEIPTKVPETTQPSTMVPITVPDSTMAPMATEDVTLEPTAVPTIAPTATTTIEPSKAPTIAPTKKPTKKPTKAPTKKPTKAPTKAPTKKPTPTVKPDNVSVDEYVSSLKSDYLYAEVGSTNGVAYDLVRWYQKSTTYYLFLPTSADNTSITLWETYNNKDIYIDGEKVVNGNKYNLSLGDHKLTIGTSTATLSVMHSANVPTVFIKTANKDGLSQLKNSKEFALSGEITFMDTDGSVTAAVMEKINGRGNTSWNAGSLFGKYPFNIKLQERTNVFGMGNNKKWCIIPQVFDESLIRNVLMNDLSRAVGLEYTPNAENVDVYFNGEYIGTYLLSQKVDLGKNKLIKSEEGFLIECELMERYDAEENKFRTSRGQAVIIKAPDTISNAKLNEISDYMQRVEDAVYADDGYNSQGEHYSDLIDVDSFVKVYLINEFSMNLDGGATSFFMYKEGNEKLQAGPVWDYDWALGSYESRDGVNLVRGDSWYIKNKRLYDGDDLALMAKLCTHEEFWDKVKAEWNNSFKAAVTAQMKGGNLMSIDQYYAKYEATAAMNFKRYDILPTAYTWGSSDTGKTYKANMDFLKNFYKRRIDFFDKNI